MMHQVLTQFGDVEPFLMENVDMSPATRERLLAILHDPNQLVLLEVELAVVVDIGVYFVKGTYNLEGDGVLSVTCYEEILKIRAAVNTGHYPNLSAVCKGLFPGNSILQQQWQHYALSCVHPGIQYFQDKIWKRLQSSISSIQKATAPEIDCLSAIQFLVEDIPQLKEELPSYLAKAADVDSSTDVLE